MDPGDPQKNGKPAEAFLNSAEHADTH